MPDYKIVRWDESNFDIERIPFTREAVKARKWAYVSDYARLYILYHEGGIYLDTDIVIEKSFDSFIANEFFSSVQFYPKIIKKNRVYDLLYEDGSLKDLRILAQGVPGIGINSAVMGSKSKHRFVKECMEYYHDKHFVLETGEYNMKVSPAIYAGIAYNYGFRYKNLLQKLEDMIFYPADIFACTRKQFTRASHAFHFFENSWHSKSLLQKIKRKILVTNPFMWFYLKNF